MNPKPTNPDLQGEGNYDATHRYNKGVEKSVEEGRSNELGEKAKKALEGSEGDALKKADEQGKNAETPGQTSKR